MKEVVHIMCLYMVDIGAPRFEYFKTVVVDESSLGITK